MEYYPGQSGEDEIFFLTGEKGILKIAKDTQIGGVPHKMLVIIPEKWVMTQHGIKEEDLDYSLSSYGTLTKFMASEFVEVISNNPENRVIMVWCGWEGQVLLNNKVASLKAELVRKDERIQSLLAENAGLSSQLYEATQRRKEFVKDEY